VEAERDLLLVDGLLRLAVLAGFVILVLVLGLMGRSPNFRDEFGVPVGL
jgi:hypothetical protein